MTIRLLYFAAVRELVGTGEEQVELPAGVDTVGRLMAWLESARPPLAGRLGQVRAARNEAFAAPDEPLGDGDVVALLPPVSGG